MPNKSNACLRHSIFIFALTLVVFGYNHNLYSQKRMKAGEPIFIRKNMNMHLDITKVAIQPRASALTQETLVTLNDGNPEFLVNPRQWTLDGNDVTEPNGTNDYFLVIFEPNDFAAYGIQSPFRITAVGLFNNDTQTTWPEISIYPLIGDRTDWQVDPNPIIVGTVTDLESGYNKASFPSPPMVNQNTSLGFFIRFPEGGVLNTVGEGGGPGIGADIDGTDDPSFPPAGITSRNGNSFGSLDGTNFYPIPWTDGLPVDLCLDLYVEPAGECFPQPVGLDHWWPGNGHTNDIIGNRNGTLRQGTDGRTDPSQAYSGGMVGQGFALDGVDDYIETPAATWGFSTSATVMAWIRTSDRVGTVFALGHGNSDNELLFMVVDGKICIYNHKSLSHFIARQSDTDVNTDQWIHVAGVLNGGGGAGNLKIFVNGVEETGTVLTSGTPTDIVDTTPRQAMIGWRTSKVAGEAYVGRIDELMLFNRALTTGEILGIYNAGAQGVCEEIPEPDIHVNPGNKDYGSVVVGSGSSQTFVVSNEGTADLNVTSPTLVGIHAGQFRIDSGGGSFTLAPGATRNINVSFNPTSTGSKTATLRIASNDPDENPKDVALSGIGGGIPDIDVDPSSKDFGSVLVGSTASQNFVVANNGSVNLEVTLTTIVGIDAVQFSIDNGEGPFTVPPGWTSIVQVSFNPTSESTKNASLRIISNDPDESPFDVPLSGKGEVTADCYQPPSGIVAWWPGDGNAKEIIGSKHGTLQNGATYSDGKVDQAFQLTGENDYVTHDFSLPKQAGTIEHWLRPDLARVHMVAYYESDGTSINHNGLGNGNILEIHTGMHNNGQWYAIYQDGARQNISGGSVVAGQWTHVVLTWDLTESLRLYVNGVQEASGDLSGLTFSGNTPTVRQFGRVGNGDSTRRWRGLMDEVTVYNRALSAGEIQALYNADSNGKCKCAQIVTSPYSWWSGDTDGSDRMNRNHGELRNNTEAGVEGMVNGAFRFNGTNQYVETPAANWGFSTTATVMAWIKTTNTAGSIFSLGHGACVDEMLLLMTGGKIGIYNHKTFNNYVARMSDTPVNTGQWVHVAGVLNGGGSSEDLKIFVNGIEETGTVDTDGVSSDIVDSTLRQAVIGWRVSRHSIGEVFKGEIDEVQVYSSALSAADIRAVYEAGGSGVCTEGQVADPDIAVNPTSKNYGSVQVGSSSSQTFLVTNVGTGDLNVTSSSLVGSDASHFSIDLGQGGFTLPPGGTWNIDVSFRPTSQGAKSASLRVLSNDSDESPLDVPLLGTGQTPTGCYSPPSGIVTWWPGDGNTDDIIGSNDGTAQNGLSYGTGYVDQAFHFDGADDRINVNPDILSGATAATIEGWIYLESYATTGQSTIMIDRTTTNADFQFAVTPDDNNPHKLFFHLWTPGGVSQAVSTSNIPLNTWTHVAGVYNGSQISVYINGSQDGSLGTTSGAIPSNSNTLWIGDDHWNPAFDGMIDELKVFNRALTASEIQSIYAAGSYGVCKFPDIAVDPDSKDYGNVTVGSSASQNFVVSNNGSADLNVTSTTIAGTNADQFNIENGAGPFTVPPGWTSIIKVSFNPTTESTKSASLRIVSNDPDESPLDVPLTGKGESASACTQPPSGLMAWWPGDGNTDEIVGAKNGTLQNGATFGDGQVDQGFQFDGIDDYVSHDYTLNRQAWTIEHWLLPQYDERNHMVAYYESNGTSTQHNGMGDNGSILEINTGMHVNGYYVVCYQDFTGYVLAGGGNAELGVWAHVAATWDQAGALLKLYVDGVEVDSEDLSSKTFKNYPTSVRRIGMPGNNPSRSRAWKGVIDEVTVYNRALTAAEILAIYKAGKEGKCKEGVGPDVDINLPAGYTGSVFVDNIPSMASIAYSPSGDFGHYLYAMVQGPTLDDWNIVRFDGTGTRSSFATNIMQGGQWNDNFPTAMTIDLFGNFGYHMYLTSAVAIGKASAMIQDDDTIVRVQSDGSADRFHITNVSAYNGKNDLAIAPCGDFASNLYLANVASRAVDRVENDGSGSTLKTFSAGTLLGGIIFDGQGKFVYVVDRGNDKILKIDAKGVVTTFADNIPDLVDLAWDRTGRFGFDLFATSYTPSTPGAIEGKIYRIKQNGTFETFASNLAFHDADRPELVFGFDGDLFILETGKNRILRVESSENAVTVPIVPVVSNPQTVGQEFWVDVQVGDQANPVSDLFGVSFSLQYTHKEFVGVITPYYANVVAGDFLGSDLVYNQTVDENGGKIDVGISRKSGAGGVNGHGTLFRAKFKFLEGIPEDAQVLFSISDLTANDPVGSAVQLNPGGTCVAVQSGVPVWPGDTNNNGLVDQGDVLPLGLYWNQTGPPRPDRSIQWTAQLARPWAVEKAAYADADGNGEVNEADVLPIGFNWGKTHTTTLLLAQDENTQQNPGTNRSGKLIVECFYSTDSDDYYAEIRILDVKDLFGLAFNLAPESESGLVPQSVQLSSWMGSDLVTFTQIDTVISSVSIGLSRKGDKSGVEGSGSIARIPMRFLSRIPSSETVRFRLDDIVVIDHLGRSMELEVICKPFTITTVDAHGGIEVPTEFALGQNMPNPFNPGTTIVYSIPHTSQVTLEVYNLLGAKIKTLVNDEETPGHHTVQWDTRDENGSPVSGGMYLYRMQAGSFVEVRKMLLIR